MVERQMLMSCTNSITNEIKKKYKTICIVLQNFPVIVSQMIEYCPRGS